MHGKTVIKIMYVLLTAADHAVLLFITDSDVWLWGGVHVSLLFQETSVGSLSELDIWLLDMQPVDGGVMLLVAAVNTQLTPQLHYAFG